MEVVGNDRRDFAQSVYEQHIYRSQVLETRRTAYFIAYTVLATVVVAFIDGGIFAASNWPVALFLLLLAKAGFLTAFHQWLTIYGHREAARYILDRYGLNHYYSAFPEPGMMRLMPMDRLIAIFYLFAFCFFLLALLYVIIGLWWPSLVVAIAVYIVGYLITMLHKPAVMERKR